MFIDYVDSDLSSAMTNSPLPHKRGKPPPVPQEQEVYDEAAAVCTILHNVLPYSVV